MQTKVSNYYSTLWHICSAARRTSIFDASNSISGVVSRRRHMRGFSSHTIFTTRVSFKIRQRVSCNTLRCKMSFQSLTRSPGWLGTRTFVPTAVRPSSAVAAVQSLAGSAAGVSRRPRNPRAPRSFTYQSSSHRRRS